MPWGYLTIIAILIGVIGYIVDMLMKMSADIKFIRMQITK
jgi:hypothetical protein